MVDVMTDKQMEILLTLVADKFAGCKDMADVERAGDGGRIKSWQIRLGGL